MCKCENCVMKDCVSMRERLSARTAEQAEHRKAFNSTTCDDGSSCVLVLNLSKKLANANFTNTAKQAAAPLPPNI